MNKNKWWLNGGRGSGRTIRLLCEVYENKIADLQHKVDTLQGFLDHDIEYDMDKTIQEQKIRIAELEKDKAYAEEQLDEQIKATLKLQKENAELKDQLAQAKEIIKKLYSHVFQGMDFMELNDFNVLKAEAEQFLKE